MFSVSVSWLRIEPRDQVRCRVGNRANEANGNSGPISGFERDALILIVFDDGPCRFKITGHSETDAQCVFEPVTRVIRARTLLDIPAAQPMAVFIEVTERVRQIAQDSVNRDRVSRVA